MNIKDIVRRRNELLNMAELSPRDKRELELMERCCDLYVEDGLAILEKARGVQLSNLFVDNYADFI